MHSRISSKMKNRSENLYTFEEEQFEFFKQSRDNGFSRKYAKKNNRENPRKFKTLCEFVRRHKTSSNIKLVKKSAFDIELGIDNNNHEYNNDEYDEGFGQCFWNREYVSNFPRQIKYHNVKVENKLFCTDLDPPIITLITTQTILNRRLNPQDPRAVLSDHVLVNSISNPDNLKIASFNACMNCMALRRIEHLFNSYDVERKYLHFASGKSLPNDQLMREMICDYLISELVHYDVICVQEIDYECIELLKYYLKYRSKLNNIARKVAFNELTQNHKCGGVAIICRHSITIGSYEPIVDRWVKNHEQRSKLIGQIVTINNGEREFTIGNFHLDKNDADKSYPLIMDYAYGMDYIVGDFNRSSSNVVNNIRDHSRNTSLTLQNISGTNENGEIDHIFKVIKTSTKL